MKEAVGSATVFFPGVVGVFATWPAAGVVVRLSCFSEQLAATISSTTPDRTAIVAPDFLLSLMVSFPAAPVNDGARVVRSGYTYSQFLSHW
jgi:hypothetical protein